MKIREIEKDHNGIYWVTQRKNIFCRYKKVRYKAVIGKAYKINSLDAYVREDGEMLEWNNPIIKELNKYTRKF